MPLAKKNAIYPNESRGDLEVASQIVEQGSFWAIRVAFSSDGLGFG